MKSAICPKCFAQLTEEQWVYRCNNGDCKKNNQNLKFPEALKGRGGQPACPDCGENFPSPFCPDCGFPIREDEPGSIGLSISLVGSQGSGKSHYLSVLIEEMKHRFSKAYSCALFPLGGDDTISMYGHEYYQPLYVHGKCLDSTEQDDVNPLIYSLVFQNARGTKAVDLTLYDACGANFESLAAMAALNRSIYHSGGILFLIDPAQLPVVGESMSAQGKPVKPHEDAVSLLSRTIHLVRAGNGQTSLQSDLDIPIAVCLTKLDTVMDLLDASSFVKAPSLQLREAKFNKNDFEACNLETQSLIEIWGGGEIISQITSQFTNYAFFSLSSLGASPEDGNVHHIAPHRVTDPLLWLLWKNKIIK